MGAPNELSFLPDDYLERKARRRTNAICAVLFCTVMGAIGSAFWVSEKSMREIDQQYVKVQEQYTDAAKRIEQVQQMQDKQRRMAHQAELTASLLEKVPRSFVLAELTNGMPPGVSLLDFQLDARVSSAAAPAAKAFDPRTAGAAGTINALASAQPRAYDVTMRATGVAQTDVQVAQFISKLNQSKLLKDVNLMYTEELTQRDGDGAAREKIRKFQLELSLNPQAKVDPETAQRHLKSAAAN
ncbi:MAG TPA: PilN domain-containing protein [Tepidisphaeraceae bacterium]|nr:PilN domain-containing protein [Tepidisphaeraceae bacterium]